LVLGFVFPVVEIIEKTLMPRVNFENLRIYELSEKLGDKVWDLVLQWDGFAKDTVGKQLVRAADSIGANIAEGSGRGSSQDYRRFLRIARGSLYETLQWLRRAYKRKLLTAKQTSELRSIISELTPTLNAYLRSVSKSVARKPTNLTLKHRPTN
jgi:four helix bundle protein